MRRPPTVVEDEVQLHHVEGAVAPPSKGDDGNPRGQMHPSWRRCTLGVNADAPRSEQMHRSNNRMEACREGRYTPEDADAPRKDDGTQSHPDNLPRREVARDIHPSSIEAANRRPFQLDASPGAKLSRAKKTKGRLVFLRGETSPTVLTMPTLNRFAAPLDPR